jgi:hypothetical protein
MHERSITGYSANCSKRARSTSTLMTTSSLLSWVRSNGQSIPAAGSRSNRRMACARAAFLHRIEQTRLQWHSPAVRRADLSTSKAEPASRLPVT